MFPIQFEMTPCILGALIHLSTHSYKIQLPINLITSYALGLLAGSIFSILSIIRFASNGKVSGK
jgi:hypothetical protein